MTLFEAVCVGGGIFTFLLGCIITCIKRVRHRDGIGISMVLVGVVMIFLPLLIFPDKSDNSGEIISESSPIEGSVSDTLTFDELEVTVNDYVFSEYLGNLDGLSKADDGNVYCTVYLDIKNIAKSSKALRSSFNTNYNFTLDYNDGYTYHSTWQEYSEFLNAHDSIEPLTTLQNVCVSFKVPLEVEESAEAPLTLSFSRNSKTEKDCVKWKLR